MTVRLMRLSGDKTDLGSSEVPRLDDALQGELLLPGASGYDEARRMYNAAIDRKPAIIARCAGAEDVRACVRFARERDLLTTIRGGGHNVAGSAVADDGFMVDVSPMKAIAVDPAKRTVRAEAGVIIRELDVATQAHGLATTMGNVSTTGIAGLTLGGGLGFLMRKLGLACDNLLAVDLVTANGDRVRASADENTELFWGLRGGGGNFGVATAFEFRVHPIGPVLAGPIVHPLAEARDLLRFYREFSSAAPDELTCFAQLGGMPGGVPLEIAIIPIWSGAIDEGERQLRAIRAFGSPLADEVATMPYTTLQTSEDATYRSGLYNYWTSHFLAELSDEVIETILDHLAKRPTPMCHVLIEVFGGAVGRVPANATAFPGRGARYDCVLLGMCENPRDYDACVRWVRDLSSALRPLSIAGAYVNYLAADDGADRARTAYGSEIYDRLAALKATVDPTNFFRMNQNVKPTK